MEEGTFEMSKRGSHTQDQGGCECAEFQVASQKGLRGNSLVVWEEPKESWCVMEKVILMRAGKKAAGDCAGPRWLDKEFGFHAKSNGKSLEDLNQGSN